MRAACVVAVFAIPFALAGCPASGSGATKDAPPPRCTRFGATCEVAPGKLGSCVQREPCDAARSDDPAACLICQSQH